MLALVGLLCRKLVAKQLADVFYSERHAKRDGPRWFLRDSENILPPSKIVYCLVKIPRHKHIAQKAHSLHEIGLPGSALADQHRHRHQIDGYVSKALEAAYLDLLNHWSC